MPRLRTSGLISLAWFLAAPLAAQAPPADLVFLNGTVYTVDPDRPRAGAVAVFGDRIVAVGTNSEIRSRIGRSTRIVDLEGRFVVPGFVDDHTHFAQAGALLLGANLLRVHDEQGLRDEITTVAKRLPEESWIIGGDWGAYEAWEEGASGESSESKPADPFAPTRKMVDDVSGSHPVLIRRFDRSMYLANGLALQKVGIDAETPDPEGGSIERDANGEPTGVLTGTAVELVEAVIREKPWEQRLIESRRALAELRRYGVTSIHDSQVVGPDDFSTYGKLGIVAEVQPYHAIDDMRWMEERIGKEKSKGAYAFKSLQMGGAGRGFVSGTDWPGTNAAYYLANPLLGIYAAVTRKTMTGEPPGGWFPEQILTVSEAIEAYTMGSAWAAYEEADKGSITSGKLADFAVLSRDITSIPHAEIKDVDVMMTILGGKIILDQEKENAER